MFEPNRQPVRDRQGYTRHPDLPLLPEIPEASTLERELARCGYDARFRGLLDEWGAESQIALWQAGDDNVSRWSPSAPVGLAWQLVAVYPCDAGPMALFVRPQLASPVGLLRVWIRRLVRPGAIERGVRRVLS